MKLLCIGLFIYPIVSAQNNIIDSLVKVLQTQKEDSNKALTLNRLSENLLMEGQTKRSMEYANASIILSGKINFKRTEASAYENRGIDYSKQADYANAEKDLLTSLRIRKEIGNRRGIAQSYYSIANLFDDLDNYPEALQNFYSALNIFQEIDDKKGIAITLESLSNIYLDQGNDSGAITTMQLALKADEQSGQKFAAGNAYFGLGGIEQNKKNYKEALSYYSKGLEIFKDYGQSKSGIALSYSAFGSVFENQGEAASSAGDQKLAFTKYGEALKYYDSAIKIFSDINFENGVIQTNGYKAIVLIKFRKFKEAREYLEKYFQAVQKFQDKISLQNCYAAFAELDSAQGNYKEAYQNYKMYILYRDSLSTAANTKKALQVKMQYDFDKKAAITKAAQDKKDLQAKRIKNQQYFAIASLGVLVLAVVIIAFIQFKNNKQKQKANIQLERQKQKVEITLTELKSTQAQLIQSEKMASLGELTAGIAHEIQNPLNFVNNFSEINAELIDELTNELNTGNKEEAISIAQDIKENEQKINHHGKRADSIVKGMLQHSRISNGQKEPTDVNALTDEYLKLSYHGMRAKDGSFNAAMQTDFDENLSADKAGIGKINIISQDIGRVLLNLFNNAFYAINEKKRMSDDTYTPVIFVSTKKINDKIEIRVKDNGNGISQKVVDKIYQPFFTTKPTGQGTGLGLSLSYDIIKAHGGEIKVETKENEGAEFTIILPIN